MEDMAWIDGGGRGKGYVNRTRRFELQSYEKVGIEVEPGRAEHTAHCFVMSRTIKGISVQSSRKLLRKRATSQPEFSPTMFANPSPPLKPSLPPSV